MLYAEPPGQVAAGLEALPERTEDPRVELRAEQRPELLGQPWTEDEVGERQVFGEVHHPEVGLDRLAVVIAVLAVLVRVQPRAQRGELARVGHEHVQKFALVVDRLGQQEHRLPVSHDVHDLRDGRHLTRGNRLEVKRVGVSGKRQCRLFARRLQHPAAMRVVLPEGPGRAVGDVGSERKRPGRQ